VLITNTIKAIDVYDLDYDQVIVDGGYRWLEKAIGDKEWIVVTGWKPHFKWAQHDLKYLKRSKVVYKKDACSIISRRGFQRFQQGYFSKTLTLKKNSCTR
jgi:glycine betaine/proline transport system substrate-binding protein